MGTTRWQLKIGISLTVVALWIMGAAIDFALLPLIFTTGTVQADDLGSKGGKGSPGNPCAVKKTGTASNNPCNPCGAKKTDTAGNNPCNPSPVKKTGTASNNPGNPCAVKKSSTAGNNPCNPSPVKKTGTASNNPCNPCGGAKKSSTASNNPCNPCGAKKSSTAGNNPCNPGSKGGAKDQVGEKFDWGTDYRKYRQVSKTALSLDHGNRLVVSYAYPKAAAQTFLHNARLFRSNRKSGFRQYPEGSVIVEETWNRKPDGSRGKPGPIFMMRKEKPGYNPGGKNWRYGFARADFSRVREGRGGRVSYCQGCHESAKSGDYVHTRKR